MKNCTLNFKSQVTRKSWYVAVTAMFVAMQMFSSLSFARDEQLERDLDSLANDQVLIERAKAMDPKNKVQVVQKRTVDLNYRFEIGGNYAFVGGGDSYLSSQNLGAYLDFHFTPRWAFGFRYNNWINQLTTEGDQVYRQALEAQSSHNTGIQVPGIDNPQNTELAVVTWAPVYGKVNFFNSWVPHFDLYVLAGAGKTQTQNGMNSDTFAGGGGLAFWLAEHFSSHFEVRYQTYQDAPYFTSARQQNTVLAQFAIGVLL